MARGADIVIVDKKKKTYRSVDFAVPADHRVKMKEREKKYKRVDIAKDLKKTMEHESDGDTNGK